MQRARLAVVGLALLWSVQAHAHAQLKQSVPADGSHLKQPPRELVLTFSENVQLTALSLETGGGQASKLRPPAGSHARISVPVTNLHAGSYVVRWRAQGADGHVVQGELHFTIAP